jgi:hypothetical protein
VQVAAVLITVNQATLVRVAGHLHLSKYGWFLLACWAFSRYLDAPSWRRGVLLGLAAALTLQGSFYFGFLLALGLGAWWLGCLAAGRLRLDHLKGAGAAAVTAAALGAALTWPVWARPVDAEYAVRLRSDTWHHGAELWEYLTPAGTAGAGVRLKGARRDTTALLQSLPPPRTPTQGLLREVLRRFGGATESWTFLGVTVLTGLGAFVVLRLRRLPVVGPGDARLLDRTAGLIGVFVVLSLAGGPSAWVYDWVSCFRCYGRAGIVAVALGCVVAPVTLHAAAGRLRSRAARVVLCAVVLALLACDLRLTYNLRFKSIVGAAPPWVSWLAEQPPDVRLAAFPDEGEHDAGWGEEWQWSSLAYRLAHDHATLNGGEGQALLGDLRLLGGGTERLNPAGLRFLASFGYDTFAFGPGCRARHGWVSELPWLEESGYRDGWTFYRVRPEVPRFPVVTVEEVLRRGLCDSEPVEVPAGAWVTQGLNLSETLLTGPGRPLELTWIDERGRTLGRPGRALAQHVYGPGLAAYVTRTPAEPGEYRLRFRDGGGRVLGERAYRVRSDLTTWRAAGRGAPRVNVRVLPAAQGAAVRLCLENRTPWYVQAQPDTPWYILAQPDCPTTADHAPSHPALFETAPSALRIDLRLGDLRTLLPCDLPPHGRVTVEVPAGFLPPAPEKSEATVTVLFNLVPPNEAPEGDAEIGVEAR